ncbi:MAG: HlyD family efflux transporter periplasmic adaptor subunit [Phycisphaerales bacterium]
MPEVAGRVVYMHSQLHAGGRIRANEPILQVDPSRYELAVRQARATVEAAEAQVDYERAAMGLRETQKPPIEFGGDSDLPSILREPRVRWAEAALESAKAQLAVAELELDRTSIVLPFDAMIVEETVSLGQYVGVGRSLAIAYGTDALEVEVPVRDEDMGRFDVRQALWPEGVRSTAEVKAVVAGREHTWSGDLVGTTGRVDPASGTISLIVQVRQPLDVPAGRAPLLPGMAVDVLVPVTEPNTQKVGDL